MWWKFSKYPSMTQLPQAWHPARATTPLRKRKGETPPNYKTTPISPRFEFLREPSRKSILSFLGVEEGPRNLAGGLSGGLGLLGSELRSSCKNGKAWPHLAYGLNVTPCHEAGVEALVMGKEGEKTARLRKDS